MNKNVSEYIENGIQIQEVDARDLEVQLVRTAALMDRHQPFVVLLTHYEELVKTEHNLDYELLGKLLGVRIGLAEDKAVILAEEDSFRHVHVSYGKDIEEAITRVIDVIVTLPNVREKYSKRYMAVRMLERPDEMLALLPHSEELIRVAAEQRARLLYEYGKTANEVIAQARRGFVHGALEETLTHAKHDSGHSLADKIDKVLTNRWVGLPLLLLVLYGVFECTFTLGSYPQEWIGMGVEALAAWLRGMMPVAWWSSLLLDGVLMGIGAVLAFLPNIIIMFFFLSLMEDSGYMARVAYTMDKIMHRIGLHGSSFIPMLMGFGCNVPAIMAAKDITNKKDRALTMMMVPFMSCSARLPVYMLFIGAFFAEQKALVMLSLYILGVLLSIVFAWAMQHTPAFRQPKHDYVSELPPYRRPTLRNTGLHIWERVADYLQKIPAVIIWASVIIWALTYFPTGSMDHMEDSYLAMIGHWIEPAVRPLGFDWKMSVCLLTGLPAKEAIVSTMGILYPAESALTAFTPVTAYAFMAFVLLYFPCVATITTLRKEIGAKWAWYSLVQSMVLAWVVSFVIYQVGSVFSV
ncbi:MAG: ferrous iron transport protein B [Paludibacteraceae bacterium]|nr:ferrous iron transport protein B [Paludibacteraceae bacterium]